MKKDYKSPVIEIINISIDNICETSELFFGEKINEDEAQGEWIW